jgi:hypothetical protein
MRGDKYDVKFGATARTLEYRDSTGEIRFSFDFDGDQQSPKSQHMVLEHHRPQDQGSSRYRIAYQRTGEFLASRGYTVTYRAFAPIPSITSADITEQLTRELATLSPPNTFCFDPFESLIPPAKTEFLGPEKWSLWVVLMEPATKLLIVFDEHSNQFGIAKDQAFFGFHGTFVQTLADLSKMLQ